MTFTHALYRPETGEIIAMLVCGSDAVAEVYLAAYSGASVMRTPDGFTGMDTTHRVEDGTLVPL